MGALASIRLWLGLALVLAASSGCEVKDCSYIYVPGLHVDVQDSQGMPLCDVTVRIQDGSYQEEQALTADSCSFSGAGERAGSYLVTALRDGAVLAETRVSVSANECHVEPRSVTLVVGD